MKRLSMIALALVVSAGTAMAQKPGEPVAPGANPKATRETRDNRYPIQVAPGEVQATPEMWFYDQAMRDARDPDTIVRRSAQMQAEQRRHRLESQRWFGVSNSRPRAGTDPYHGDYSPYWSSNNTYYPNRWVGGGTYGMSAQPEAGRMY